jgi:hypothetical protein
MLDSLGVGLIWQEGDAVRPGGRVATELFATELAAPS